MICEKFVYKHLETIKYIKIWPIVSDLYKPHGQITREFLGLKTRNFRGIAFIWTQTNKEIFKSALVYL